MSSQRKQIRFEVVRNDGARVSFERVKSETFAVPALRKMLGVADKKCLQWSDLRTVVIEPAIKGMQGAVNKNNTL